jgi:hypothetical protein
VTTWMDVSRALRRAGWRHSRTWLPPERDGDGAPISDDDVLEHTWRRGSAEISAYSQFDTGPWDFVNFVDEQGSDELLSVHVAMVERRGFVWLNSVMILTGILP